jgi:hypothetical protein
MKRFGGTGGIRDLFGSFSSAFNDQYKPLKYYCMNYGKEHREIAYPNCGSKMKKGRIGYLLQTTFFLGLVFFTLLRFWVGF